MDSPEYRVPNTARRRENVTTPNELAAAIARAQNAFMYPSDVDEREPGFEVGDMPDDEIQMRKACRSLILARALLPGDQTGEHTHQRHYAAAIELAFNVIERSCQAALLQVGQLDPEDFASHAEILEMSHRTGYWDEDAATGMSTLFQDNRTKYYYRDGIPSETRARSMMDVASLVHDIIAERNTSLKRACLCGRV